MSGHYIINASGQPEQCDDLLTWAKWFEKADRVVGRTELEDGVVVSTVFLGLDHSFGHGCPLLYETMVFGGTLNGKQDRYETREEAVAGHLAWVEKAKWSG